MKLTVNLKNSSYPIYIRENILTEINEYVDLNRNVIIITDDKVPRIYAKKVLEQCLNGYIYTVPSGEIAKSFKSYTEILEDLIEKNFSRKDLVIAVGGGVCGDLAGFVAASYMRGIDFVNVPTTILSQVDSSIGGKVGINACGKKNMVGAFHQPKVVFIDITTHQTLDKRQISNGLAELIKHGLIFDKDLFNDLKTENIFKNIDEYIYRSLLVKKQIVELDENESGLRKCLNFGHTIGHAIESYYGMDQYLHGESVAIGMVQITKDAEIRNEIIKVLRKYNLPTEVEYDKEKLYQLILHDKKAHDGKISLIILEEIGIFKIIEIEINKIVNYL